MMPSSLLQVSSTPPVSSRSIRPFSKHSMANEIVVPAPIVSRPYSLHQWLAACSMSMLQVRFMVPKEATVSYSARWVSTGYLKTPFSCSASAKPGATVPCGDSMDSAPQAIGQRQQP